MKDAGAKGQSLGPVYVLATIIALLAMAVSTVGLRYPSVYRAPELWAGAFTGNDLITLVAAVPVLALGIVFSVRGSVRWRMVMIGALYYMFYNYAFYVFGMQVTKLYLPLVTVFALSGFTLVMALGRVDIEAIGRRFSTRLPARIVARLVAAYMLFVAIMVGRVWISQWINFMQTGKIPDVNGDQNGYKVIAAVDLSFMIMLLIPAAYWLWRRRPLGYVMGVMLQVQGALYTAVMATGCVFDWLWKGTPLFSGWFIGCVIGTVMTSLCLCGLLLSVEKEAEEKYKLAAA